MGAEANSDRGSKQSHTEHMKTDEIRKKDKLNKTTKGQILYNKNIQKQKKNSAIKNVFMLLLLTCQ